MHRHVGGSCSTHNMKVIFKVAENSEQKKPVHSPAPSINVARSIPTSEGLTDQEKMGYKDIVRPIEDVRSFHTGLDQITKGRYDRYDYELLTIVLLFVLLQHKLIEAHITSSYLIHIKSKNP